MTSGLYVICSFALNFGVPAAILMLDVRSMRSGKPDGDVEQPQEPGLPPLGLPPETLKPLPECLIPRVGPVVPDERAVERELELA
jgi:hypothetical protein